MRNSVVIASFTGLLNLIYHHHWCECGTRSHKNGAITSTSSILCHFFYYNFFLIQRLNKMKIVNNSNELKGTEQQWYSIKI